tara:strand:+ start:716 stop:1012 length:297 start_codon:yes stop_codon:yes gene_type:complete
MPYINESARLELDDCIDNMVECLTHGNNVSNEEFIALLGEINYTFTRILAKSMGEVSYSKIAMTTGVLENIKQEFYRRIAASYEDKKIVENGDIKEYR